MSKLIPTQLVALAGALIASACSGDVVDLGENQDGSGSSHQSRCRSSTTLEGPILVESQAQLDELEGCEVIGGHLTIAPFESANLRALHQLRRVHGGLTIGASPLPETAPGNESLQSSLRESGWLDSLQGLEGLRQVEDLWLEGIDVDTLEPLSGLTLVEQGFYLQNCRNLERLTGLENVEGVRSLDIFDTPVHDASALRMAEIMQHILISAPVESLDVSSLRTIYEFVVLSGTRLTDLDMFAEVDSIAGSIELTNNDRLVDASGLDARVATIRVTNNPQLERLADFDRIIPASVLITSNPRLIELPTFAAPPAEVHEGAWETNQVEWFHVGGNASLGRVVIPDGWRRITSLEIVDNALVRSIDLGQLEAVVSMDIRANPVLDQVELGDALSGVPSLRVVDNPSLDSAVFENLSTFQREMSGNAAP
jgi:hypothetical protein